MLGGLYTRAVGAMVVVSAATLFGYLFLTGAPADVISTIQAFAAGAILTMVGAGSAKPLKGKL